MHIVIAKHEVNIKKLRAYKEHLQLFTKICTNAAEAEKTAKNPGPNPDTTTTQGIVNHQLIA